MKISDSTSVRGVSAEGVALDGKRAEGGAVWNQPYLETCCRAALHRLFLAGPAARPADQMDGPCLMRLAEMGFCDRRADGRFALTSSGTRRHATEVLKHPTRPPPTGTPATVKTAGR